MGMMKMKKLFYRMVIFTMPLLMVLCAPSQIQAMNQAHHRKTVMKAFQLLDDPRLGMGWLRDWYEDHEVCFDCYPSPAPLEWGNDDYPQYEGEVDNVMEAVAAETYNTDDYQDLAMCNDVWGADDCRIHIVDIFGWDFWGIEGWFVKEKNLTSFLHFVDTTKIGEYNDEWDGYSCDSAKDIEYEIQDIPALDDEYVDSMTCDYLGNPDGPGVGDPEGYLHLNPDYSPALYRYITVPAGSSACEEVATRFCRNNCDDICDSGADGLWLEDVDFPPASNLGRYWYTQWIDTENPLFLGPVMHAVTDATVPHHASGYLGNWHRQFEDDYAVDVFQENFNSAYEPSNWVGEEIEENAIDLALGWLTGPGQSIEEIVQETAQHAADFMSPYLVPGTYDDGGYPRDDEYNFVAGDAYDLQAYAIGRVISILHKAYEDVKGSEDPDLDGIVNDYDNCDYVANPGQENSDEDALGDACDNCHKEANTTQSDLDGDEAGDVCDLCKSDPDIGTYDPNGDTDGDGVGGSCDNCLCTPNPRQYDLDEDRVGNECDVDIDGDTVLNTDDNCVYDANLDQLDCDEDGLGAACDTRCPDPDPCSYNYTDFSYQACALRDALDRLAEFPECLPQLDIDKTFQLANILPKPAPDPNAFSWDFSSSQYGEPNGILPGPFCDPEPISFLKSDGGYLTLWNLSNPLDPLMLGSYNAGSSFVMERFRNFVLIGGVNLSGDSTPTGPTDLLVIDTAHFCPLSGYNRPLSIQGPILDIDSFTPHVYITVLDQIHILDMHDPLNPIIINGLANTITADKAVIHGRSLYLFSKTASKMEIYSLSDPINPQKLSTFRTRPGPVDIEIQDNFAYIAANKGIQVVDLQDPARPKEVKWIPITEGKKEPPKNIDQRGFPNGGNNNSHRQKETGGITKTYPSDLSVHPGGLFAVTASNTLSYYDLATPSNPTLKTTYEQSSEVLAIATMGDYTVSLFKGGQNKIYLNNMNYETTGFFVSTPVADASTRIVSVQLRGLKNLPENTYVNYYYSMDAGKHWARMASGPLNMVASIPGDQILFAAVLGTGNPTLSPRVWEVHTEYNTLGGALSTNTFLPMNSAAGYDLQTLKERFEKDMEMTIAFGKADIARRQYDLPSVQDSAWEQECVDEPETTAYVTTQFGELMAIDLQQGTKTSIAIGLDSPNAVAVNRTETVAYVAERNALTAVDLRTKLKTQIASGLSLPTGIILDPTENLAYVTESVSGELSEVNLTNGSVRVIASGLNDPRGLSLDNSDGEIYVAEYGSGELSKVNLTDGSITLVSSLGDSPYGVAVNKREDAVYVSRFGGDLVKVNLADGNATVIVSNLGKPENIGLNAAETVVYLVEVLESKFLAVDLLTKNITVVASSLSYPVGLNLNWGIACLLCQPATETKAYVVKADASNGELVSVDLSNGATTPVASGLAEPFDIVVDAAGTTAYVTEGNSTELSKVDLVTGTVTTVSSSVSSPYGVALTVNEDIAYVTELYSGQLIAVNLATGNATVVASGLTSPKEVELSPSGSHAYVVESGSDELSKVDLATGTITLVASKISSPRGLALNATDTTAYVTDGSSVGNLFAVDIATGNKTLVASGLVYPQGVTLNEAQTTAFVTSGYTGKLNAVDLATGTVTEIVTGLVNASGVDLNPAVVCP